MTTEPQIGKRAQNKKAVRDRLLAEGRQHFSTLGYEYTTVADIVAACGLGRGTFYNYFSDVKELFEVIVEDMNIKIGQTIKQSRKDSRSLYDFFYNSFLSYFDFVSSGIMREFHQKNQAYIRSASYKSDAIRTIVADLQADLNELGLGDKFREYTELQLLSYVFVGTPSELYLNNMSVNSHLDNAKVAAFLAQLFTSGLAGKAID